MEEGSRSVTWYATATRREPLTLPPGLPPRVVSRLIRLRLGYRCASQILQTAPDQCPYCFEIEDDPLHHYILRCPVTQALRHQVAWIPDTDNEAAALAIASASTQMLANLCSRYPPP
ncbi:hypothetical protein GWK47_053888 [Chionoecetes opilio]|uniref:Uncharacterized protein n=1 Tax=Chionoecetes opilio TaxID=41210 RepID=A0A8J5CR02_CHIOP|nr:hypothetical protein GWK47_053888 [Chionoecetes opilio]